MNETTPITSPSPARRRRFWMRIVAGVLVLVVGAGVAVWQWQPALLISLARLVRGDDTDPGARREALEKLRAQDADATTPADRDAEYRQAMLGSWTQSREDAERELLLRADGTGLQVIRPQGLGATFLLGERVELDVVWKVEDGRAVFDSVAGRPADKAEIINQYFGTHRNRRIVEITDERILLFDEEDNKPSEWKRAAGVVGESNDQSSQVPPKSN